MHGYKQAPVRALMYTRVRAHIRAKILIASLVQFLFMFTLLLIKIDVYDVLYTGFGPYLYRYFCLLHGPTVLLLIYCYI